ncbi:alanine dehydrogenase [Portibacter marinus]|uniref:alanine dehydrogenase n=1 Tax=Portibacter marinus TaxID=2898660 RepID=UPI001F207B70|nr:alanine dehydrogenase [Portibacter marinus]
MSNPVRPGSFSTFFAEGQYETQTEMLEVVEKSRKLTIGIPLETTLQENRVAIVPNSIRILKGYGHDVLVESGAGKSSSFTDRDYTEAEAEVTKSKKKVYESHIIIKTQPPTLDEIDLMQVGQILVSPMPLPIISKEYIEKLQKKKVYAIAMEHIQSEDGSYPIVRMMSEIAGMVAMLTGAQLLTKSSGGRGVLLGGISGVPPAKVVILGAGVVGEHATRTALGLGASVRIFDNDIYKLMRLQNKVGRPLHTSALNPVYLGYQLLSADVVIGAIHSKNGRAPVIVTEEMVAKMKDGAVIIDVSIDQGGCFETSEVSTLKNPTFIKHGVIHYCVPNIASNVGRTASISISNIITPIILKLSNSQDIGRLLFNDVGIRSGVYIFQGKLTNEYLAKRYDLKYTDLNLILTSGL